MDVIFLSQGVSRVCEDSFILLRSLLPNLRRVHGGIEKSRLLSICAEIAEEEQIVLIDGSTFNQRDSDELQRALIDGNEQGLRRIKGVILTQKDVMPALDSFAQEVTAKDDGFDIVYLTYDEPNADENFFSILQRYPEAMRLHRVTGMTKAFALTAQLASTSWYILIDGDNILLPSADLTKVVPPYKKKAVAPDMRDKSVLTYGTTNTVNYIESCYGGIKVCPTLWFRGIDVDSIDPIASRGTVTVFSPKEVLSITNFNADPFGSWKAGFREAVMLYTALSTDFQGADHWARWLKESLETWKTAGTGKLNGEYCMDGAREGERFAQEQMSGTVEGSGDAEAKRALVEKLSVINLPGWLKSRFEQRRNSISFSGEADA